MEPTTIVGVVLAALLTLLVSMVSGVKKDTESLKEKIGEMVKLDDYKTDKKTIDLKLDEHGRSILTLEIIVNPRMRDGKREGDDR
jgi:hypothetical protein